MTCVTYRHIRPSHPLPLGGGPHAPQTAYSKRYRLLPSESVSAVPVSRGVFMARQRLFHYARETLSRHTLRVCMSISEVRVRCTGHLSAISSNLARCSSLNAPCSSISRSMRSSLPSFVSHDSQSLAWIFAWRSVTVTSSSGHFLRRA